MFFSKFNLTFSSLLISLLTLTGLISSCSKINSSTNYTILTSQTQTEQNLSDQWREMTEEEENQTWQYILNSPLGIAALNQLAIEGFISPVCPKTFYVNQQTEFQTLLQVECPTPRGTSIAVGYDEIRVIFNRFEDNIENFEIERISSEQPGKPLTLRN